MFRVCICSAIVLGPACLLFRLPGFFLICSVVVVVATFCIIGFYSDFCCL